MKFFNEGISPLALLGGAAAAGAAMEAGAQTTRAVLNRTVGQCASRTSIQAPSEEDIYQATEEVDAATSNGFIRPKKK